MLARELLLPLSEIWSGGSNQEPDHDPIKENQVLRRISMKKVIIGFLVMVLLAMVTLSGCQQAQPTSGSQAALQTQGTWSSMNEPGFPR